jgi:hypothetical protein
VSKRAVRASVAKPSPSAAEVLSHFGERFTSDRPHLQIDRWIPRRRCDPHVSDGRSRAAERQRCETRGQAEHLKVWRSNATSDVGSPRSSTCISRISAPQAKHFIAVPPGYRPEIERQGLIVSSVSNHVAFTAMTCVLDARILRVTIGGGAASSHERPRAPFTA